MNTESTRTAHCLCGSVRITAQTGDGHFGVCHCKTCRKWGGGPMFAVDCKDQVRFDGEEHIATFSSSEWAERGFCSQCGTHLFYRLKQHPHYAIPVGLFDDDDQWQFAEQVFIDNKPPYYSFSDDTRKLTEAEVFAMYSGSEG